jgi:hypothetical protein
MGFGLGGPPLQRAPGSAGVLGRGIPASNTTTSHGVWFLRGENDPQGSSAYGR